MRNIFLILSIIISNAFANNYELKLYEKVMRSLFHKNRIMVYADMYNKRLVKKSDILRLADECSYADIVLGNKFRRDEVCSDKPVFATDYRTFRTKKNSIGAFYWKKGRPQLKFDENKMRKFHMVLPSSLQKYKE